MTSPNAQSSEHGPTPQVDRIALTKAQPGQTCVIDGFDLSPSDRRLLGAMGLRDQSTIVLCRVGEPCIVRVMGGCGCSSRIGLARPLASNVFVKPTMNP